MMTGTGTSDPLDVSLFTLRLQPVCMHARLTVYPLRLLQTTTAVNLVTMTDVEVVTSVVTTEAVTTTEAAVVTTGEAPAITGEVAEAAAVTETSAATTLGLGTERSRVGGPRSFWTVAPEDGTEKKSLVVLKHPPRLCFLARFLTDRDVKMRHGLD
jgi:hypothetical protein